MELLNKKSAVPLYEQLKVELKKLIVSGFFKSGREFFSLSQITKKYQVSQITARRVIEELVSEGFLVTSKGRKPKITSSRHWNVSAPLLKVAVFFYSKSGMGAIEFNEMPWTSTVFSSVQEALLERNALWSMVPCASPRDALAKFEHLKNENDAFLCLSSSIQKNLISEFDKLHCPYVVVQPYRNDCTYNFVAADEYSGSAEIVMQAIPKNYRSYLYLIKDRGENPEKLRGFQETLLAKGVPPERIHIRIVGSDKEKDIEKTFLEFTNAQNSEELFPLAVYSFGDKVSLGIVKACKIYGLKVPEDVGVAGSTGLPEAKLCNPPLTTIQIPMRQMGRVAVDMIFEMLSSGNYRLPGIELDVRFVKGKSL